MGRYAARGVSVAGLRVFHECQHEIAVGRMLEEPAHDVERAVADRCGIECLTIGRLVHMPLVYRVEEG